MKSLPALFEGHYDYLLQEILESIDDAVLVFGHDSTVVYANEAAEDVFGNNTGLVGVSVKKLVPKEKQNRFNEAIATLKAS